APHLDTVRVACAVLPAQVAPVRAALVIAVFEQRQGLGEPLGAEVHRYHRLSVRLAAPAHEFVGADLVGLGGPPGKVETGRPLVARADAIHPVIVGDEIAARIPDQRDVQIADQIQHVTAEAVRVGCRMAGLVNAAIDGPSEVLEECTVDAVIDGADLEVPMYRYPRLHHAAPLDQSS